MATDQKLQELVNNGIGQHKEYDSRIHIHYDVNMFKYATSHNGLLLVESNSSGKYITPPCRWVERNMPELKSGFCSHFENMDRKERLSLVGTVMSPVPYKYNPKSLISHGLFSYSHGRLQKGKSHYSWRHIHSVIKNAAETAAQNGLTKIFLTRVYGGHGGVLFSALLDDVKAALGDLGVEIHFFVPKDPDQSIVGE